MRRTPTARASTPRSWPDRAADRLWPGLAGGYQARPQPHNQSAPYDGGGAGGPANDPSGAPIPAAHPTDDDHFGNGPAPASGSRALAGEVCAAVVDHSLDGVLLGMPDGSILYANPAACSMLRASSDEICHRGRQGYTDPTDTRWDEAVRERAATGRVRADVRMRRSDGSRFLAEITSAIFTDAAGTPRTCVFIREVTDRVRLERRLAASDEITRALLAGAPVASVLAMISRHARRLLDATDAAVLVPGDEPGTVVVAGTDGARIAALQGRRYPPGTWQAQVMAGGESRVVENLTAVATMEDGRRLGLGPAVVVPIVGAARTFGNLFVGTLPGGDGFGPDELAVVESFARAAGLALALDDARQAAEREHRTRAEQLQTALDSRIVIEQAKGMIAATDGVDVDEAFARLRRHARQHSRKIHDVAADVVARALAL